MPALNKFNRHVMHAGLSASSYLGNVGMGTGEQNFHANLWMKAVVVPATRPAAHVRPVLRSRLGKHKPLGWRKTWTGAADRVLLDTRPAWPNIGPDFVARMGGSAPPPDADGAGKGTTVVPFRRAPSAPPWSAPWAAACALLAAEDRAVFDAWIAPLVDEGIEAGQLLLAAPTRFHASYVRGNLRERLMTALRRADPSRAGVTLRG